MYNISDSRMHLVLWCRRGVVRKTHANVILENTVRVLTLLEWFHIRRDNTGVILWKLSETSSIMNIAFIHEWSLMNAPDKCCGGYYYQGVKTHNYNMIDNRQKGVIWSILSLHSLWLITPDSPPVTGDQLSMAGKIQSDFLHNYYFFYFRIIQKMKGSLQQTKEEMFSATFV